MKQISLQSLPSPEIDHIALARFAEAMRQRLMDSNRCDWEQSTIPLPVFFERVLHNVEEAKRGTREDRNNALADAANYLMFIWNRRRPYG